MVCEDVCDDGREQGEGQRYEPIDEQQDARNQLDSAHEIEIVRGDERANEGAGHSSHRGRRNKVKEPIQAENDEYQPKKDPCDYSNDFNDGYLTSFSL